LIAASAAFLLSKPWQFRPEKKQLNLILLFIGFVVFHAVSLIWTQDFNRGLKELETYSALFTIPVLLLWQKDFHGSLFINALRIVIVTTTISICFTAHAHSLFTIYKADIPVLEIFFNSDFHYTKLSERVNMHPTYLGMLIVVTIILQGTKAIKTRIKTFKFWLIIFSIFYLILFLTLLLTRGPILGLLGIFSWLILVKYFPSNWYLRVLIILIFIFFILSIFVFEPLNNRFIAPVIRMINEKSYVLDNDSFSYHIRSWICSLHSNQTGLEVLIGQGTGDELTTLNNCYASKNYSAMINSNLNAHCEYLTQYVKLGLLGLGYLIFFLLFHFNNGNKNSFSYLKLIVIFLSVIFLFESALNVSKGVFFISFLFPYFYLLDKENAKTSI
jgi:hypothetical protein